MAYKDFTQPSPDYKDRDELVNTFENIHLYEQMSVWQKAFKLLIQTYKITQKYPKEEKYGLVSDQPCRQAGMRRAVNSVVHNISEGFGRFERLDKSRFYKISRGSSYELVSQIMVSHALNYICKSKESSLIQGYKEVINEIDSLIKTVEKNNQ